jgi:hypothetical protein
MGQRRSRHEDQVGLFERGRNGATHVFLVSVTLVVDAPERKPYRSRADHGARTTILFPPRQGRLTFRREAAA